MLLCTALLFAACGTPEEYRGPLGQNGDAGADADAPDDAPEPDVPTSGAPDASPETDAEIDAEPIARPASCSNAIKDGLETDLDCGGPQCPACAALRSCVADRDCMSRSCVEGLCLAIPACRNTVLDKGETDIDCGGLECALCGDGKTCLAASDCMSRVCNGVCLAASCTDGLRNGTESDQDCGSTCPNRCATAKICHQNGDCQSNSCTNGRCDAAPSCTDDALNGLETDKDCGGMCPACGAGKTCKVASDCLTGVCSAGTCESAPSCQNKGKDGAETDIDCGGPDCSRCAGDQACTQASDCISGVCLSNRCTKPPVLKVQHQTWEYSPFTRDIKFKLQILSESADPRLTDPELGAAPKFPELKVRYWFNDDGFVGQYEFVCDWAAIMASYVRGRVVTLPGATNPLANAYLELSFTGGKFPAPIPGTQTRNSGIIQARFHGTKFPTFDQSNDYSFDTGNPNPADEPKLTLYLNDVLVWGQEPVQP